MDYDDQGLAAMPKLVGGPKYSRPPVPVERAERPPDPDDLPLMSEWTPEDEELAAQLGLGNDPATTAAASGARAGRASAVSRPDGAPSAKKGAAVRATPARRMLGGLFRGR